MPSSHPNLKQKEGKEMKNNEWKRKIILRAMKKELDSRGVCVRKKMISECFDSVKIHNSPAHRNLRGVTLKNARAKLGRNFKKEGRRKINAREVAGYNWRWGHTHRHGKWEIIRHILEIIEQTFRSPRSKIGRMGVHRHRATSPYIKSPVGYANVYPLDLSMSPYGSRERLQRNAFLGGKQISSFLGQSKRILKSKKGLTHLLSRVIRTDVAYVHKKTLESELKYLKVKGEVIRAILDGFDQSRSDPIWLHPQDFVQSYHGVPLFLDLKIREFCKKSFVSEIRKKAHAEILGGYREVLKHHPQFTIFYLGRSERDFTKLISPWEVRNLVETAKNSSDVIAVEHVQNRSLSANFHSPTAVINWIAELYYSGRREEATQVHHYACRGIKAQASLIEKYMDLTFGDIFGGPIPKEARIRVNPAKVMDRFLKRTAKINRNNFIDDTSEFSGSEHGYTRKDFDRIERWLGENRGELGDVTLIRTPGRLAKESIEMSHCVWDYFSEVDAMETVVFHIGGGPLKEGTTYGWSKVGKRTVHHNGLLDRRPYSREEEVAIKIQEFLLRFMS